MTKCKDQLRLDPQREIVNNEPFVRPACARLTRDVGMRK